MFGKHIGPISVGYRIVGLAFGISAIDGLNEEALGIDMFRMDSGPTFPTVRTLHKVLLALTRLCGDLTQRLMSDDKGAWFKTII
jgi:hypothetical protein